MKLGLFRWIGALAASVALLGLAGCSTLSSHTVQYIGVSKYAPTDAARVEILQSEPTRPHERVGEVVLEASTDPAPPVEKIERELRTRAARLGADAVLLVHDHVQNTGVQVWWGPWWSPSASAITSRLIVGVAIHYRDH
jgi:hypothetical protein